MASFMSRSTNAQESIKSPTRWHALARRAAEAFPSAGVVMAKTPDPTKDPEFQKVVQTFLHTKPQPHKPAKRKAAIKHRKKSAKTRD
jgi:hypothetical protein